MRLFYFWIILLPMLPGNSLLAGQAPFTVRPLMEGDALGPFMDYHVDRTGRLTSADILGESPPAFTPNHSNQINLGIGEKDTVYWARLHLHNPDSEDRLLYIESGVFLSGRLTAWMPGGKGGWRADTQGLYVPRREQQHRHNLPLYSMQVPPGLSTVLFRLETDGLKRFVMSAYDEKSFWTYNVKQYHIIFLTYGAMLMLIVFSLIQWYTHRSRVFGIYSFYMISLIATMYLVGGYGFALIFDGGFDRLPVLLIMHLSEIMIMIMPVLFTIHYFNLDVQLPRIARIFRWSCTGCVAFSLVAFWFSYAVAVTTLMILPIAVFTPAMLCVGLYFWRSYPPARYFVAGWSIYLAGFALVAMGNLHIIDEHFWTQVALPISTCLENLAFTLGLARMTRLEMAENRKKITSLNRVLNSRIDSLRRMAAGVAHEINNPLAIASGNLEIMSNLGKKGPIDPEVLEKRIGKVRTAVGRAARIVGSLLTYAGDKKSREHEWVDPAALIDDVVQRFHTTFREQSIHLNLDLPGNAPGVSGQRQMLTSCLEGLLQNAVDALSDTPGDSRQISIRMDLNTPDRIRILIADNGAGPPKGQIKLVFEPFFTTRQNAGRVGLGLSMARSVCEEHGGFLTLRSEGRETIVTMDLPRPPLSTILTNRAG